MRCPFCGGVTSGGYCLNGCTSPRNIDKSIENQKKSKKKRRSAAVKILSAVAVCLCFYALYLIFIEGTPDDNVITNTLQSLANSAKDVTSSYSFKSVSEFFSNSEKTDLQTDIKFNETEISDVWEVNITGAKIQEKIYTDDNTYYTENAGFLLLLVKYEVKNISQYSQYFNIHDFNVYADKKAQKIYSISDDGTIDGLSYFSTKTVPKGDAVSGYFLAQVPENWKLIEITYAQINKDRVFTVKK